jgi:hypothetical protein
VNRLFLVPLAVLAVFLDARIVLADGERDFQACASAFEEAQRLKKKGRLVAASDQATACAAATCPSEIVGECTKLRESIDEALPTIVVAAEHDGQDVAAAKLLIDGRVVAERLDGLPKRLDPGNHVIRVVPDAPELAPRETTITVRSGERNRRVELGWQQPMQGEASSIGFVPAAVAFALGGAGIVVGATTGILALTGNSDLEERCSSVSSCPADAEEDIDRVNTLAVVSTTGFVVGGIGIATGIVLAAVAASQDDQQAPSAVQVTADGFSIAF